jgi:hypothetical protein
MSFSPYSKEKQLGYHKTKKPKKKKNRTYKGRTIPTRKVRGKITKSEYERAKEQHGFECYFCGKQNELECHHVYFRSSGGRGTYRNLRFLCSEHHRGVNSVHKNRKMRKQLEELHKQLYGEFYYCDRFDLFQMGMIPNTTKDSFEKFMREEGERAKTLCERNKIKE